VPLVDELDASLHPALVAEFVRLFQDPEANPKGAQLIFTSHDTTPLGTATGDRPLSREQVWLAEKRVDGAIDLYPLTDAHPRKEENLERGDVRREPEAWCLFDRDEHGEVDTAVAEASRNGVRVAVSHPCIELWLLLHFQPFMTRLSGRCGGLTRKLRRHEGFKSFDKYICAVEWDVTVLMRTASGNVCRGGRGSGRRVGAPSEAASHTWPVLASLQADVV
jgi:hypothetical protein